MKCADANSVSCKCQVTVRRCSFSVYICRYTEYRGNIMNKNVWNIMNVMNITPYEI